MEKNKILEAHILDIIFDGKNKEYGAYQLRRSYKKTLTRALVITGSVIVLVLSGIVLTDLIDHNSPDPLNTREHLMAEINTEEPPPPKPLPPPPKTPERLELNQVRFVPPVIVNDVEVKPEDKIPDITDETAISKETIVTDNIVPIVQAPVDDGDTKVNDVKKKDDENEIFTKVEKQAAFEGGEDAWRNYLQRTLNPSTPTDNGAEPGVYKVIIKFIVSKDGSVSGVTCENDPGFGMCQEAVRVIKRTKNWIPAIQNGHNVNAYHRQPIVFVVE